MKTQYLAMALLAAVLAVSQACGESSSVGGTGGISGTGGATGGTGGAADSGSQKEGGQCFDAGSDPNRNKVQAGTICERIATIQCASEACCCNNPERSFDECKNSMKSPCVDQLLIDAIAANPIIGFDATLAEQAFANFETKASQCDITVAAWGTSMAGMRGILKGTVEAEQSCLPADLQSSESTVAALVSCKDGANVACLPISEQEFTCKARGGVGSPCYWDLNCTDRLYCDNPNMDLTGATCAPRKTVGATCSQANECESLYCKKNKCVAADQQVAYCLG